MSLFIETSDNFNRPMISITNTVMDMEGKFIKNVLEFRMITNNKKKFMSEQETTFEYLNKYWVWRGEAIQNAVFTVYKKIHEVFDFVHEVTQLNAQLKDLVVELMSYHSLADVSSYAAYFSDITYPADMPLVFVHDINSINTKDQTYILSEYKMLLVLALSLKAMIPVWNEYILNIKEHTGDQFKELYAFYLLQKTEQFDCEAIRKLELYIERTTINTVEQNIFHLKSVSKEDFVPYLLAQTCVKKLCMAELSVSDTKGHLVSCCHNFLGQRTKPRATPPEKTIRNKNDTSGGNGGDDQKPSLLEGYQIATDLSFGSIARLEYSIKDIYSVGSRLAPGLSKEFIDECIVSAHNLLSHTLMEPQMMLLQWVMRPVISPKGLAYISEVNKIRLLGLTQAILFYRGHKYLSLISTARPMEIGKAYVVSDSDAKIGLSEANIEALVKVYPFHTPNHMKQKDIKAKYMIFESIAHFVTKLGAYNWKATASSDFCKMVLGGDTKAIPQVGDVRNEVARLLVEVGSRNWPV